MKLSKRIKVVMVDNPFDDTSIEESILKEIDAEVSYFRCRNEREILEVARDADAIIDNLLPLSRETIFSLTNLKIVSRLSVGYDNIDLEAATEKGVIVCNVPDYCTAEVAEHTLALMLSLLRKIPWIDLYVKEGEADFIMDWKKFAPIYRLRGKNIGIIGFGRIGREVAKRLNAFEVNILVYDPYIPKEVIENFGATQTTLDDLLRNSDIILIHCPLTKETHHLIDKERIALMKRSAILVNVSRGAVINEKALYEALEKNIIQAAALDVFEKEPLNKTSPFLKLRNVILTPHIAWYSEESLIEVRRKASEEILRFFKGVRPRNIVNPEVLKYYPGLRQEL